MISYKMWVPVCIVVFLFGADSHQPQASSDYDYGDDKNACIIPQQIKNGHFVVEGSWEVQPKAGDRLYSYLLRVSCDPGYQLTGFHMVSCDTERNADALPQCVPFCKTERSDLVNCGFSFTGQEAKCFVPGALTSQLEIPARSRKEYKCGIVPKQPGEAAKGAVQASKEDVGWFVGVYLKASKPYKQICGGTLITNRLVISAAHCFWHDITKKQSPANYLLAAGKIYQPWGDKSDSGAQKSGIQDIRIPPRFRGAETNFQDNIALVIPIREFVFNGFITPACLDFDEEFEDAQLIHGKLGRLSGFGMTSDIKHTSPVLSVAFLPNIRIEDCFQRVHLEMPAFVETITSDKICAGYDNGTTICQTDNGSGLTVPAVAAGGGAERHFVRGVLAAPRKTAHACDSYVAPTFTRLAAHQRFITAALRDLQDITIISPPANYSKQINSEVSENPNQEVYNTSHIYEEREEYPEKDVNIIISKPEHIFYKRNNRNEDFVGPENTSEQNPQETDESIEEINSNSSYLTFIKMPKKYDDEVQKEGNEILNQNNSCNKLTTTEDYEPSDSVQALTDDVESTTETTDYTKSVPQITEARTTETMTPPVSFVMENLHGSKPILPSDANWLRKHKQKFHRQNFHNRFYYNMLPHSPSYFQDNETTPEQSMQYNKQNYNYTSKNGSVTIQVSNVVFEKTNN